MEDLLTKRVPNGKRIENRKRIEDMKEH